MSKNIIQLIDVVTKLRDKTKGCPWDLEQDMASLVPYTVEELHELIHAIANHDQDNILEELGDLLFHIVFYSHIAQEQGSFGFEDVIETVTEKLIRRHPHVFNNPKNIRYTEKELREQWQQIKKHEKQSRQTKEIKDVSGSSQATSSTAVKMFNSLKGIPALAQSIEIQNLVASEGFDWPNIQPVFDKVREELLEIEQAISEGNKQHIEEEIGDLLFAVTNLCRHAMVDPELTLQKANLKFQKRYAAMAEHLSNRGLILEDASLEQMEASWSLIK
jgi:nucleoside triphosphate diphosphatase